MNVLRSLTISFAFYSKFATFSCFQKMFKFLFRKTELLLWKNQSIGGFEKSYYLGRVLEQICHFQPFLIESRFFPKNPFLFVFKKKQILNVLTNLTTSVAFYSKNAKFSHVWEIHDFLGKPHLVLFKTTQILNDLRNLSFSVAF